jgi:hypothetical protein
MKRSLLSAAAGLAAWLTVAALAAQAPAPTFNPGLLDDDWATPKMSFEEMSRQVDALGAAVGSAKPWRDPDPAAASPAAWREAVLRAPRLTAAQVLAQAERPRLGLRWTEPIKELYGKKNTEAYRDMIVALEAQGRRTGVEGSLALELSLGTSSGSVRTVRGGREIDSHSVALLNADARLLLPVRVLRGDQPQAAVTVLAHAAVFRFASPSLTRELVADAIKEAVAKLYAQVAEMSATSTPATDRWARWLADAGALGARHEAFRASFPARELPSEAGLAHLTGFRAVLPRLIGTQAHLGVAWLVTPDELQQGWTRRLNAAGFHERLPHGPELRHDLTLARRPSPTERADVILWSSRAAIHDDDCLAVVGGRFVRVAGDTHVEDSRIGYDTPERAIGAVRRAVQTTIDLLARQLGQGGAREGQARHTHADAVADYLRPRQLVPVPEQALAGISNRIAQAFAAAADIPESARREFIYEHQGRRIYDLARVGTMRQGTLTPRALKEAITRVIHQLTLSDPIGFAAFHDIWNHDRGYRRPELPAEFAARLARPRPSGAGTLRGEKLETAGDVAYGRVNTLDPKRAGEVRAKLREFDAELRAIRVLACDYIPADGNMHYTETRKFLYRTTPPGWAALVARLPPELNLGNLGPASTGGPDTLAEADKKIAARR